MLALTVESATRPAMRSVVRAVAFSAVRSGHGIFLADGQASHGNLGRKKDRSFEEGTQLAGKAHNWILDAYSHEARPARYWREGWS